MRQKKSWFTIGGILAVLAMVLMLPPGAGAASKYKVLYKFSSRADGAYPDAALTFDAAGNLYGTTQSGGAGKYGTVFKLTPNADGSWTKSVLHSFSVADGADPFAGVIFDTAGDLYGTTRDGGDTGNGVVFKLVPNNGSWTESVLYSFAGGRDGAQPYGGLIFDTVGNLYGMTTLGGWSAEALCSS
jgi:uncharacterized repeat protein (TIGR03803 family)